MQHSDAPLNWSRVAALAALVTVGFTCYGTGVYAFTQFLTPVSTDFGWGRAVTGGAMSAFWVASPLVPWIAVRAGREGSRRLIIAGGLLEGASFCLLALVGDAWQLYALRVLMGLGKLLMVVPIPIELARLFGARAGFAVGIAYAGWHLGGVVLAPVAQALIASYGWREASIVLGVMVIVVILSLSPWFESLATKGADAPGAGPATGVRRAGALLLGRPASRNLTIVTTISCATASAILVHISPLLSDAHVAAPMVASLVGSIAFSAMVGVLLSGAATQRWSTRTLGLVSLLGFAVSTIVLLTISLSDAVPGLSTLLVPVLLFGLILGGADAVWFEQVRRLSAPQDFPAIYGCWYLTVLVTLTVAPVLAGAVYDATGSYWPVFAGLASSLAIAGALLRFGVPASARV
jgi:MFS family permease